MIGYILICTAINLVCWFVFGATDFTVKENIIHSLVSEAIFLLICFGSYLLAGGIDDRTFKIMC